MKRTDRLTRLERRAQLDDLPVLVITDRSGTWAQVISMNNAVTTESLRARAELIREGYDVVPSC